jgi:hypothetical protein
MARRLFVAGLLIAAACSKKEGGDAPKPADKPADPAAVKPADKPAEKPADPAAPAAKIKQATNVDDLGMLPIDSETVLGVNVALVQTSPLWKDFLAPQLLSDSVKATLEEFKAKCNVDPLAVVNTASIGFKEVAGARDGVIIVHGPDKAKVTACADKMKAEKDAKVTITQDGDATIVKSKTGDVTVAYSFLDDTTAVIVIGAAANAAGIQKVKAKTGGLATSAAFVDMFNRIDTEKTLWMLLNGKNKMFAGLAMAGIKPTHAFGNVDLSDGINLDLRLRLASADQATQSAMMMKSQLGPAAGLLKIDKIDVSSDAQDLKLNMIVSKANIGPMIAQVKNLAKTMGGGGMAGPQ